MIIDNYLLIAAGDDLPNVVALGADDGAHAVVGDV